ncbi:MAG: hypothetical protein K0Q65_27 [Clostridia bacterium]|nr:hypothetical protein [Clostridia bacterium]
MKLKHSNSIFNRVRVLFYFSQKFDLEEGGDRMQSLHLKECLEEKQKIVK